MPSPGTPPRPASAPVWAWVLGGIFADWLSWRVGFFVNVPIAVALIVAARRYITETDRHPGRFDLAGAFTSTLGMGSLVYGIVRAAATGWGDPVTLAAVALGIVLLTAFALVEARALQPILPLRLFASRERSGAYLARVLFLGGMVGFWFFTTQFLQGVLGLGPAAAGIAFLPTTIPNFISAMMVPKLTRRLGNGHVLAMGLILSVVGMAWLSRAGISSTYLIGVALPMVLIGIGQGMVLAPLTVGGVAGVEARDAGAAAGAVNTAHQLGGSLGLAILVVVFAASNSSTPDARAALAHRIGAALSGGALLLALALLVSLVLIVRPARRTS